MIESLCKTCEKRYTCIMYEPIATVAGCSCFVSQKKNAKTNADRIREMTDEELAMFLTESTSNALLVLGIGCREKSKSAFDWLDWLKQEADE